MKKLLVTGSKGYVGRVVVPFLNKKGFSITEIDSCWYNQTFSQNNQDFSIDVRNCDLRKIGNNFDAIVYLSAVSNDPMGKRFEQVTHDINAKACLGFARQAKKMGVRRFVFASSCSMYGAATDVPRKETDELNPLTAYARSKVWAEDHLRELADDQFQVTALRFATACGASPNLRLDLVLNDFVASAVLHGKIEVLSDGTPWRPLVHVDDMARAIHWALKREPGKPFLSINIGSDEWTYQVRELAEKVQEVIPGTDLSINTQASSDKRSYKVDFPLFRNLAPNHQPRVSVEDAIKGLERQIRNITFDGTTHFRESIPYIRLKTLEHHIASGRLDKKLYWTKGTK